MTIPLSFFTLTILIIEAIFLSLSATGKISELIPFKLIVVVLSMVSVGVGGIFRRIPRTIIKKIRYKKYNFYHALYWFNLGFVHTKEEKRKYKGIFQEGQLSNLSLIL